MKKLILSFTILLIGLVTDAQITFQKSYGGIKWEYVQYMQQTSDSGYIITGSKPRTVFSNNLDVFLLRLDVNGNFLWTKTYGGTDDDIGLCVQQTLDGGYVIAGLTESYGMGLQDAYLIKTDSSGNIQWSKVMGTILYDLVYSVRQTADSGYIFAGLYDGYNGGITNVYLIKTNAYGDTLWTKALGGAVSEYGASLQITGDGGFIITGQSNSFSSDRVYLLKTDSIGNPLWAKTYGGLIIDGGRDVQNTTDGGFIITGYTYFGAGNSDVYLIKTDSIGDTLWTKTYGSPDYESGASVQQTNDGGYIVTGYTAPVVGSFDIYIIKTNSIGDTLWTKTIIGAQSATGGCTVLETYDGGYVIAADGNFVPANSSDILLIKTDSLGNSGCNTGNTPTIVTSPPTQVGSPATSISSGGIITLSVALIDSEAVVITTLCLNTPIPENTGSAGIFNIYPNPSNGNFSISSNKIMNLKIIIYNIFGEVVYTEEIKNLEVNLSKQIRLPATGGIYFIKMIDGEKYYCRKLIVE